MLKLGRVGTRNIYVGPNGKAMIYPEAKAAFARIASLKAELDAEIAYSKATGLGDHAKVSRILAKLSA